MDNNTIEIMNKGMNCLVDQLGVVNAEQFISVIMREQFDYTKWQKNRFEDDTLEELNAKAVRYRKMMLQNSNH